MSRLSWSQSGLSCAGCTWFLGSSHEPPCSNSVIMRGCRHGMHVELADWNEIARSRVVREGLLELDWATSVRAVRLPAGTHNVYYDKYLAAFRNPAGSVTVVALSFREHPTRKMGTRPSSARVPRSGPNVRVSLSGLAITGPVTGGPWPITSVNCSGWDLDRTRPPAGRHIKCGDFVCDLALPTPS